MGCSLFSSNAQDCSIKQAYAYQRTTIPGRRPAKTLDETGKQIEPPVKNMTTLFIYVEVGNDCIMNATGIWINEKSYHITQEEVINLPVVIRQSHPGGAPDTLVKQTNNKVFRILAKEEWPGKKNKLKNASAKIIIEYRNQSKTCYYKIDNIKKLAPMVLQ